MYHSPEVGEILTASGRYVRPLALRPEDVCIEDIASALSKICRFTGHTTVFYSVAQHSRLVASLCAPQYRLWGLLHDAGEAYLNDLARPVKYEESMVGYRLAETEALYAIACAFLLPWPMPEEVHHWDNVLLATEERCLMAPHTPWWFPDDTVLHMLGQPVTIIPQSPEEAKQAFLEYYDYLRGEAC